MGQLGVPTRQDLPVGGGTYRSVVGRVNTAPINVALARYILCTLARTNMNLSLWPFGCTASRINIYSRLASVDASRLATEDAIFPWPSPH